MSIFERAKVNPIYLEGDLKRKKRLKRAIVLYLAGVATATLVIGLYVGWF